MVSSTEGGPVSLRSWRFGPVLLLCWSLIGLGSSVARADGPVETFFLAAGEGHPDLLRRTVAVLSLTVPTCLDADGRDPPTTDVRRRARACGDVAALPLAEGSDDARPSASPLPLAATQPFSGWDFDGVRVVRYPVLAIAGEILEVVVAPQQLATVRFDLTAWKDLPRPEYLDAFELLRFDRDGVLPRYREVAVSLLNLSSGVRFFERPDPEAPSFTARRETLLPESAGREETFGFSDGLLAIDEIRDGFAHIVVLDPCGEILDDRLPAVGWLRLRDAGGGLTVWPQIGLIC